MMLKLTLSAAVLGSSLMFAGSALACPGMGDQEQTASLPEQKNVVLTGVISQEGCPMEAADMACTGYVLTADKNAGKYMIGKNEAAEKMLAKVKNKGRVTVTGDVSAKEGKALLKVAKYKPAGNA
jgi:hypothetical protein